MSRRLRSLVSTSFPSIFSASNHFHRSKNEPNLTKFVTSSTSQSSLLGVHGDTNHFVTSNTDFRSFSASSRNAVNLSSAPRNSAAKRTGSRAFQKQFSEIVGMIRRNENNFERELNLIGVSLSVASITQIFQVLNKEKVPALRFFNWVRDSRPDLRRSCNICSLVIENLGRLNDFESMTSILNGFKEEHICLTPNAFRFLPELMLDKDSLSNSVTQVVRILSKVGGSCEASGVRSLIELFSGLGSLEMARFVMQITEANTSYYNIMIREMCRKCDLEGARGLLEEMRLAGCEPDITSFNFVLSILCKRGENVEVLLREMENMGCYSPDEITFEMLVLQSCKVGRFDVALGIVDKMLSLGIEPRLSTHAAIVKGYFGSQRYEEAHNYVVGSSLEYKPSINAVYSLLAGLHLKNGDAVHALNIVSEMIGKGLIPHFRVYKELLGYLRRSGKTDLAEDLKIKLSTLSSQTTTETGDL